MAQADLSAEAADQVEPDRQHDVEGGNRRETDEVKLHRYFAANRPCGRTMRTTIMNRKAIASRSRTLLRYTVPKLSITPSTRLAISVPNTLPSPPRTMIASPL